MPSAGRVTVADRDYLLRAAHWQQEPFKLPSMAHGARPRAGRRVTSASPSHRHYMPA